MKKILSASMAVLVLLFAAQSQILPVPVNLRNSYEKGIRTNEGVPGKNYWQNKAEYDINIEYDPPSRMLKGVEEIVYYNNSPDTLREIIFKLYPNLYQKGSVRLRKIGAEDVSEGMSIDEVKIGGGVAGDNAVRIDNTNMSVKTTLAPGRSLRMNIRFSYVLNKFSHIRTGEVDNGSAFIAYFFPRIAVYDDIDGWNRYPYLGTYEFYHDFCDFRLSVKVPERYLLWATGDHQNAEEIFTDRYLQRLRLAEKNDELRFIIDSADFDGKYDITKGSPYNIWKFEARNVTDIAFALSDHYLWQSGSLVVDSSSGRRTRVDAVFNKQHKDYFHVASDAWKTVHAMSYRFPIWPFPFNHITVFDGLDQMEYPMMVNDNPVADRSESIMLTVHEVFHSVFPFYMGTNETKYGWMDEGWATIGEWLITPMIDSSIVNAYGILPYERAAGKEADHQIMTLTTDLASPSSFLNSYPKPGLAYLYVNDMLGEDVFFKALHFYIQNWNGKHPAPLDFFNCMNSGGGRNLNWFWKRWFYDAGYPDLSVEAVNEKGSRKNISIRCKGTKPVPVDITVNFTDGTAEKHHQSIAVWEHSDLYKYSFRSKKKIKSVTLGSTYTVDINKLDNRMYFR